MKQRIHQAGPTVAILLGGLLFIGWAVLLLVAVQTKDITTMALFGDAFAPVTVFFAWVAAVSATWSYETQKRQFNDERQRTHTQRFDDLFFRLLDYYEAEVKRSERVTYFAPVRAVDIPIRRAVQTLHASAKRTDISSFTSDSWRASVRRAQLGTSLLQLADQVCAILRWLRDSRVENVRPYGELLKARLPAAELWFWQLAIACGRDEKLIQFAGSMGLIGFDRGMTVRQALTIARSRRATEN